MHLYQCKHKCSQLKCTRGVVETHIAVSNNVDADPTYSTIQDVHPSNDQQRYPYMVCEWHITMFV